MELCLGFYCLFCWDYILNICVNDDFEEWVRFFFENWILEKCVSSLGNKFCEVCLCDSEEEEVMYFCIYCNEKFCVVCIKCYKKGFIICKYEIVFLSEIFRIDDFFIFNKEGECVKY